MAIQVIIESESIAADGGCENTEENAKAGKACGDYKSKVAR